MSKTTTVRKIVKFNGRFEFPSTVVLDSPTFLWIKPSCNEPVLHQRRTADRKSQQLRKSKLERDIKPRNIILCIRTVDILNQILFPLPNILTDISTDKSGEISVRMFGKAGNIRINMSTVRMQRIMFLGFISLSSFDFLSCCDFLSVVLFDAVPVHCKTV